MASLYDHTVDFYERLLHLSEIEDIDGEPTKVFRGKVTEVYRELGISQTHYSNIRKALIELGCIVIIRQGARDYESIIALYRIPEEVGFRNLVTTGLTASGGTARIVSRVEVIEKSLGGIDVKKAFIEQKLEMEELRARLAKITREVERFAKSKKKDTGPTY